MENQERHRWTRWLPLLLVVAVFGSYTFWSLHRPLPQLQPLPAQAQLKAKIPTGTLAWPAQGQAAVGITGTQILQTHGSQAPLPIASTAKLITVLSVMQEHPLTPGQQGPTITLTDKDVALYNNYMAQGGSVMRVTAGEQISEYQMMQAIMLPSANNIADSLAIWAFGSLNTYQKYANNYISQLGLHNTRIGTDASGLSPTTTSTAQDLVKLGNIAMQDPVLSQIVGQQTASGIPLVNDIKNVNFLLGTDNIIGIKTGNTEEAGGVFVGAATTMVNNKKVTIVTAVAGAPSLFAAMKDSLNLINSAQTNFKPVTVVKDGATVGGYDIPWGGTIAAIATDNLETIGWAGSTVTAQAKLRPIPATAKAGQTVGTVKLPKSAINNEMSVPAKLQATPTKPSAWWRLTHPLQ